MERRKLLALVAAAAAAAVAAVLAMGLGGGSPQAGSAAGGGASGWDACGQGPAVAVVYAPGQEELAAAIKSLLERQLAGAVPNGTRYCTVDASRVGLLDARVLPLILVRGEARDPRLEEILLNTTLGPGFRPVAYDVAAMFALQVSMARGAPGPRYGVSASLYIVQGHYNVTSVDTAAVERDRRLLSILSAAFAANITGVEAVPPGQAPGELVGRAEVLPAVFVKSNVDLAEGTLNIEEAAPGFYRYRRGGVEQLLTRPGLLEAWELLNATLPPVEGHPAIGGSQIHIAIFEDFMCPFCARFYNATFPFLEEQAAKGRVTLHFMDLVVHQSVRPLHVKLLCLYHATHNASLYISYVKKLYRGLLEARSFRDFNNTLASIEREVSERLGDAQCPDAEQAVMMSTQWALGHGIEGTPGFVAWREGSKTLIVAVGYDEQRRFHDKTFFENLIEELGAGG